MPHTVTIAGRPVGPGHRPFIVAELSANHNGDFERALALVHAAKQAGADAIKLQTYTPETMTIDCEHPDFRVQGGPWHGHTLFGLYDAAQTPWSWHKRLFEAARSIGLTAFSSPFDATAVERLEGLGAPAYKIASFELVDLDLVRCCAQTGKPLIMSTGIATPQETGEAVEAAQSAGATEIILLHCISAYPAPADESNLATIPHLAQEYGVVSGLSDHTLGVAVSVAAVALGASFIEKHVTLKRSDGGFDAAFSLEPAELKTLVEASATAFCAVGVIAQGPSSSARKNLVFRRSLYIVRDVQRGEALTRDHVRAIRPGYGLSPAHLSQVLGRRACQDLPRGTALQWTQIECT